MKKFCWRKLISFLLMLDFTLFAVSPDALPCGNHQNPTVLDKNLQGLREVQRSLSSTFSHFPQLELIEKTDDILYPFGTNFNGAQNIALYFDVSNYPTSLRPNLLNYIRSFSDSSNNVSMANLSEDELLKFLVPLSSKLQNEMEEQYQLLSSFRDQFHYTVIRSPLSDEEFNQYDRHLLINSVQGLSLGARGVTEVNFPLPIIFLSLDEANDRPGVMWVPNHERDHTEGGSHDKNGDPLRPTPLDPMSTFNTIGVYSGRFDIFKIPGNGERPIIEIEGQKYLALGSLNYYHLMKTNLMKKPQSVPKTLTIDGKKFATGAIGPDTWFDQVVVQGDADNFLQKWWRLFFELPRVFGKWHGIDWAGVWPLSGDAQELWHRGWNRDYAEISLLPGKEYFQYELMKIALSRGYFSPAFLDANDTSFRPFNLQLVNIPRADIRLYGPTQLNLNNHDKALIHIDSTVSGEVDNWGGEDVVDVGDESNFMLIHSDNQADQFLNLIFTNNNTLTFNNFKGPLQICAGSSGNGLYGPCPSLSGASSSNIAAANFTMVAPTLAIGLTAFAFLCGFLYCCCGLYCGCCCLINGVSCFASQTACALSTGGAVLSGTALTTTLGCCAKKKDIETGEENDEL